MTIFFEGVHRNMLWSVHAYCHKSHTIADPMYNLCFLQQYVNGTQSKCDCHD